MTPFSGTIVFIPDAATVAAKWAARSSAASQDYVTGAQQTTKDPTALAIQAGPRYLQRVQDAFNSGKWANGLRRAGKAGWLDGVTSKGAANYSTGVQAAEQKYQTVIGQVLSYESAGLSTIASMANVTAADRKNRMTFWFDYMSRFQRTA